MIIVMIVIVFVHCGHQRQQRQWRSSDSSGSSQQFKPTTWVLDHDRIFIDIAWGFVDYVCGCVCRVATAMNVAEVCRSRSVCRQIIG